MFVFSTVFVLSPMSAVSAELEGESEDEMSDEDALSDYDGDGSGDDAELWPSTYEVLAQKKFGLGMHIGQFDTWQRLGLQFDLRPDSFSKKLWLEMGGARGLWKFEQESNVRDYELNGSAYGAFAGVKYFFSEQFPIYFSSRIAPLFWSLKLKPVTKTDNTALDDEAVNNSDSRVRATTLSTSLRVGGVVAFSSGFYIDVCLIGMGYTRITSKSIQNGTDEKEEQLKQALQRASSWGVMNIRLGYVF